MRFRSFDGLATATLDELLAVDGVGEIVAESVLAWFADPDNHQLVEKFRSLGVWPEDAHEATGPLLGKSFVITGSLASMGRDIAAEKIRSLGGTFQSSVGKGTTYLVAGGKVGESKLAKAASYGTEVIDEDALLRLLGY